MNISTIALSNDGVTLTTYVLDSSPEMPNASTRPAILICPGGGYRVCSDREAEPIAMAFLAEGYHAFVLRYSLNEQAAFPRPLHDAEEALALIRSNSREWGVNPEQIAVCGFSAGGHVAAAVATLGGIRPNALILGYPCVTAEISSILPTPVPGLDQSVDASTPPTFIFHTYEDGLVPVYNALAFATALDQARVPFELHIFQKGMHGLSLAKPHTSGGSQRMISAVAAKWFELSIAWLQQIFTAFEADDDMYAAVEVPAYSVDVSFGVLWSNLACQQILSDKLPLLNESAQIQEAMNVPLRVILSHMREIVSEQDMVELDQELKQVPVLKSK